MALTKDTLSAFEDYKTTLGTDEVIVGNEKVVYAEILPDSTIKEYIEPTVCFTKWNKEESLTLSYPDTLFSDKTLVDGELKLSAGKEEFYFRQHDSDTMKFGLILNKIPDASHIVTIDGIEYYQWQFKLIGWENFDFFYQPPLKNVNPDGSTWEEDSRGGMSIRPVKINGSYAVYHKSKRNHIVGQTNYQTGKFCNIYKPRLLDIDGIFLSWVNLVIKNENYILRVPKGIIDNGKYPLKFNDEFGYHPGTPPGTQHEFGQNFIDCVYSYSPGGNGTLTKVSGYVKYGSNATARIRGVVYLTSDNTLIAVGVEATPLSNATWLDSNLNNENITAATNYMVGLWFGINTTYVHYDSGTGNIADGAMTYHATNQPSSPLTWSGGKPWLTGRLYGFYATYTASGGGAVTPYGYLSTNKGYW